MLNMHFFWSPRKSFSLSRNSTEKFVVPGMETLKAMLREGLTLNGCNELVWCNTLLFWCSIINSTPFHQQSESSDIVTWTNPRGSFDLLGIALFTKFGRFQWCWQHPCTSTAWWEFPYHFAELTKRRATLDKWISSRVGNEIISGPDHRMNNAWSELASSKNLCVVPLAITPSCCHSQHCWILPTSNRHVHIPNSFPSHYWSISFFR